MRYFLIIIIVLIVNAVAMTTVYFYISHQIDNKNRQVLQAQQEINQFSHLGQQMNSTVSSHDMLQAKEQLIEQLEKERGIEKQLLSAVSLAIPKKVWLTEWLQTEKNVVLNGYAVSNDILADFISMLSKNPVFSTVSLTSTQSKKIKNSNVYQFKLVCALKGGRDD